MLTRHLYRYDEVRSALLWCIAKRRVVEGLFWAQELLVSELYDELFQILFEGWLWFVGVSRVEWVLQFWKELQREEVDPEAMMGLLYSLLLLPVRDCSVVAVLMLGTEPMVACDRLPPTPQINQTLLTWELNEAQKTVVRYLAVGKALCAWRLVENEPPWASYEKLLDGHVGLLESLEGVRTMYYADDEDIRLACHVVLVGYLCLSSKQKKNSAAELAVPEWRKEHKAVREEWASTVGRRRGRAFAIPRDCLSWLTSRGMVTYQKHTLRELRNINTEVLREKGCAYWTRRLEEANPWKDDYAFEAFMEEEFPDDIPDEWSKEDQEKSHGYGVLNLKEGPMAGKLLRKWFQGLPCWLVWGGLEKMIKVAEKHAERVWWGSGYSSLYLNLPRPLVPTQALKREVRIGVLSVQPEMKFERAPVPVVVEQEEKQEENE